MTVDELIQYTEQDMKPSNLKLSDLAKSEMKKRYTKSENEGGYSNYWKEVSLAEANTKRFLKVISYSGEDKDRVIIWG